MSKWTHGCGCKFSVYIPRGYGYREITVECGSTVNQCQECAESVPTPPAWHAEDWGDDDA